MVVAGADVGVAAQPVPVPADHEDHLAVGLQADHAVGDMHARLLQAGGPLDVVLLVKAGLQLQHHRHLLAVPRRSDERLDHPGTARGPVQGHLDRPHLGVTARFAQKPFHRGDKGLVGMLDEHRAVVADLPEDARAAHRQLRVVHRPVRRPVQLRPVEPGDFEQVAPADEAVHAVDIACLVHPQFRRQHALVDRVHVRPHLHPDDLRKPAVAQGRFDQLQQVVGRLLVRLGDGVAGHPEHLTALHHHVREEHLHVVGDQVL